MKYAFIITTAVYAEHLFEIENEFFQYEKKNKIEEYVRRTEC